MKKHVNREKTRKDEMLNGTVKKLVFTSSPPLAVKNLILSHFPSFLPFHNRLKWIGKIFHFNWWNKSTPTNSAKSFLAFFFFFSYDIKEELLRWRRKNLLRVIVLVNNCFCIENYVNKIEGKPLGKIDNLRASFVSFSFFLFALFSTALFFRLRENLWH